MKAEIINRMFICDENINNTLIILTMSTVIFTNHSELIFFSIQRPHETIFK